MTTKDILQQLKDRPKGSCELYRTLVPEINFNDFEHELLKLEKEGLISIEIDFHSNENYCEITEKGRKLTNTLVIIGHLGTRTAYLNVDREEALERWEAKNGNCPDVYIEQFNFDDEFGIYDAWEIE